MLSRNGGISYSLGGRNRGSSGPITLTFLNIVGFLSIIVANVNLDCFGNFCDAFSCLVISLICVINYRVATFALIRAKSYG